MSQAIMYPEGKIFSTIHLMSGLKGQPNPDSQVARFIQAARKALGLSQDGFAERFSCTKANVSAWENGRHEPAFSVLLKISEKSGISLPNQQNVTSVDDVMLRRVPLISHVQAGKMVEAADPYAVGSAEEMLLTMADVGPNAFALRLKGESMLPDFKEGDIIIVDPSIEPMPGDFVVAKNGDNEATFKKYRPRGVNERGNVVFELMPLNEDYPSIRSDITPANIIGVMVEHRRYRRR